MRFVKPSSIGLRIVEGMERKAGMANMACLGSDLVKEWGDVGTVGGRPRGLLKSCTSDARIAKGSIYPTNTIKFQAANHQPSDSHPHTYTHHPV